GRRDPRIEKRPEDQGRAGGGPEEHGERRERIPRAAEARPAGGLQEEKRAGAVGAECGTDQEPGGQHRAGRGVESGCAQSLRRASSEEKKNDDPCCECEWEEGGLNRDSGDRPDQKRNGVLSKRALGLQRTEKDMPENGHPREQKDRPYSQRQARIP